MLGAMLMKKNLLGILLLVCCAQVFATVPTVTASVSGGDNLNTSSFTTTAISCTGTNRVLWVAVGSGATTTAAPNAVKFGGSGGTSLTQISTTLDPDVNIKLTLWRLIAPTTTSSTVYASWAGAQDERWVAAICVQDADQTTPNGTVATATAVNSTAVTVNATSVAGQLVLDFTSCLNTSAASPTYSVGAGQTQLQNLGATLAPYENSAASLETAAGTSTTMSWTISQISDWGQFAFAVTEAAGGGGVPSTGILLQQMSKAEAANDSQYLIASNGAR